MQEKDLLYNTNTGELKATIAKKDGPVYKKYIEDGYVKIGTASGMDLSVNGLPKDDEHNEITDKVIAQVVKDVQNGDILILGDWLSRIPTEILSIYIKGEGD